MLYLTYPRFLGKMRIHQQRQFAMPSKYKRSTKPRHSPTGRKAPPTGTDADLNLASMSAMFSDEDKARELIESRRWPNGDVFCPHCGEHGAYKITSKPDSKHK